MKLSNQKRKELNKVVKELVESEVICYRTQVGTIERSIKALAAEKKWNEYFEFLYTNFEEK